MANIRDHQATLCEQLLLLHELYYSDLDMPYQGAAIHSNKKFRDSDTNHDVRLLETIAVALTTGKPGDVFAAAFDRREKLELVLEKNGPPDPEDIEAATELISLIESPEVTSVVGLLPFLIRRCGRNINKRIHSLHTTIQDHELREDFRVALQTYTPSADLQLEFPQTRLRRKYKDSIPSFNIIWEDFLDNITNITTEGLQPVHDPSVKEKISKLFFFADAIARSSFLKSLVTDRNLLNQNRKERTEKFKWRLGKVCQYVRGIEFLIQKAKRLAPISYRWVMDDFSGSGEGVFTLCDDPRDAVSRARGLGQTFLSPDIIAKLDQRFPSLRDNWERQRTAHTCIHAELRIILHLASTHLNLGSSLLSRAVIPIGVSKRSCFCCTLWIGLHNLIFRTQWMTSRSHGKLYANWALPGAACPYAMKADGNSLVDKELLKGVEVWLLDTLDRLFPGQKRISDEHATGDDSPEDEEALAQLIDELFNEIWFD